VFPCQCAKLFDTACEVRLIPERGRLRGAKRQALRHRRRMRQLARLPHRRFVTQRRLVGVTHKQQDPGDDGQRDRQGVGAGVSKQLGVGRQIVAANDFLEAGARRRQLSLVRVCQTGREISEDQGHCVTIRTAERQEILDDGLRLGKLRAIGVE